MLSLSHSPRRPGLVTVLYGTRGLLIAVWDAWVKGRVVLYGTRGLLIVELHRYAKDRLEMQLE